MIGNGKSAQYAEELLHSLDCPYPVSLVMSPSRVTTEESLPVFSSGLREDYLVSIYSIYLMVVTGHPSVRNENNLLHGTSDHMSDVQ